MIDIETVLKQKTIEAVSALYNKQLPDNLVQFQQTRKEFEGDITLVVFPLLKFSGKGPEQTAQEIGAYMQENTAEVASIQVVKGFLNLSLSNEWWISFFNVLVDNEIAPLTSVNPQTVLVEYSSPNTNKPLHLGHLRNIFLGFSVAKLQQFAGNNVVKMQIVNDRGIHICKSMLAWQKFGNAETPQSTGLKGDKLVGKYYVAFDKAYKAEIETAVNNGVDKETAEKTAPILLEAQEMLRKWEAGDAEVVALWKTMNSWVYAGFDVTYKKLNVDFDKLYYESETYETGRDIVLEGLQTGVFFKKENGSVWIDLTDKGLDEKLVLRGDGTSVYMTQDIGTASIRYKDFPDLTQVIYTVGNEQDYHFKVLFEVLKAMGYAWAHNCYHLSYGMVDLPSGKMKSREGTVVDADDLVDEIIAAARAAAMERGEVAELSPEERDNLYKMIGLGALKYFILKVDPKKRMLFDPSESIDLNGNTAPFIQYTHARIAAIKRKAGESGSTAFSLKNYVLHAREKALIARLKEFPSVAAEAASSYSPALVANYCYELAKEYNQFYHDMPIFKAEEQEIIDFRVALSLKVGETIKICMNLLGIDVPERM